MVLDRHLFCYGVSTILAALNALCRFFGFSLVAFLFPILDIILVIGASMKFLTLCFSLIFLICSCACNGFFASVLAVEVVLTSLFLRRISLKNFRRCLLNSIGVVANYTLVGILACLERIGNALLFFLLLFGVFKRREERPLVDTRRNRLISRISVYSAGRRRCRFGLLTFTLAA